MANAVKTAAVAELAEAFRGSSAVVLTEYRGLSVKQLKDLRQALGGNARYAIVKNTLTKLAAGEAGVEGLDQHLSGPTAIAFVSGDAVEAARGIRDFSRTNQALVIKAGVVEGRLVTPEDIRTLADLEPRDVLLAKLAGAMKGSLSQAVGLFAAPMSQVARLAAALAEIRAGDAAGADAPPAESSAALDEPAADPAGP